MPEETLIRVFSDLHLGHPSCRIQSAEQLRPLLEGADQVVFNGDTTEQRHRRLIERGKLRFAQLTALLEELGINATYLCGNHDPEISSNHAIDIAGGKVFISHGDAMFRHLSPWSPKVRKIIPEIEAIRAEFGEDRLQEELSAILDCTSRCRSLSPGYENEFRPGRLKHLRTATRFAWPPLRPVRILHTWLTAPEAAHRFAERYRPGARAFLFGHTHFPGVWRKPGRTVINTGGFVAMIHARVTEIRGDILTVRKIVELPDGFRMGKTVESIELR